MGRIKGFVSKKTIHSFCRNHSSMVYMEEIPKTAIRGEGVVNKTWNESAVADLPEVKFALPEHLIGKRVSFIIIPEDD